MKVKDVELFRPYRIPMDGDNKSFFMFLSKEKEPVMLEHNHRISSISMHRWKATYDSRAPGNWRYISDQELDLEPFKDFRYLVKTLFESIHKNWQVDR
jgi:hypothetical protein